VRPRQAVRAAPSAPPAQRSADDQGDGREPRWRGRQEAATGGPGRGDELLRRHSVAPAARVAGPGRAGPDGPRGADPPAARLDHRHPQRGGKNQPAPQRRPWRSGRGCSADPAQVRELVAEGSEMPRGRWFLWKLWAVAFLTRLVGVAL